MVVSQTRRRKHVAELRRLARRFGIALTGRDAVGRAKVLAMVAALKAACLDGEATQQVLALEQLKLLSVARRYPNAEALVPSMHRRIEDVLRCKGGMTKY